MPQPAVSPVAKPIIVTDPIAIREQVRAAQARGRRVGFVPTMGALHDGHTSLVDRAACECDDVAVSIFVNPTQFGPSEDFSRYPRSLESDIAAVAERGARWVFAPEAESIYPPGWATRVEVEGPARRFEGEIRPGHFSGVATVVCRLLLAVPADEAYFGAKDWQQTLVIRRMVRDLGVPTGITVCPTVREPDGLAMSSRNAYLTAAERSRACGLFESLRLAEQGWLAGETVAVIERAMAHHLAERGVTVDYAAIVDRDTLDPLTDETSPAVALVAGRLGMTRLIDNILLPLRR